MSIDGISRIELDELNERFDVLNATSPPESFDSMSAFTNESRCTLHTHPTPSSRRDREATW